MFSINNYNFIYIYWGIGATYRDQKIMIGFLISEGTDEVKITGTTSQDAQVIWPPRHVRRPNNIIFMNGSGGSTRNYQYPTLADENAIMFYQKISADRITPENKKWRPEANLHIGQYLFNITETTTEYKLFVHYMPNLENKFWLSTTNIKFEYLS